MKRYRLYQGKLREHPDGEFMQVVDVADLQAERDRYRAALEYIREHQSAIGGTMAPCSATYRIADEVLKAAQATGGTNES